MICCGACWSPPAGAFCSSWPRYDCAPDFILPAPWLRNLLRMGCWRPSCTSPKTSSTLPLSPSSSSSVCSSSGPRMNRGIFLPRCCGRFL
ncbi:MAG: hypothetical protein ACK55Z_33195 [bacterium]